MAINFSNSKLTGIGTSIYDVNEFKGVDYTTTPTKVDDTRAIEISNYMPQGTSLVKRYGYDMLHNIRYDSNFGDFFTGIIEVGHGVYDLEATNNQIKILTFNNDLFLIMSRETQDEDTVRNAIYIMTQNGDELEFKQKLYLHEYTFLDEEHNSFNPNCENAFGFELGDYIWLFAFGSYFRISKPTSILDYSIKNVMLDGLAYVPTLALNVLPRTSNSQVIPYEQLNMLTNQFKLDLKVMADIEIDSDDAAQINSITFNDNNSIEFDIGAICGHKDLTPDLEDDVVVSLVKTDDATQIIDCCKTALVDYDTNTGILSFSLVHDSDLDDLSNKVSGTYEVTISVTFAITSYSLGINDYGIDTIDVKTGTLYGSYSSKDRIFIAHKNVDYHTLDDKDGKPNYTYFGTETYNALGNANSDIVGYSLLNDGSLAIFKDNKDISNIYVRTAKITTTTETYQVYDYVLNKYTNYDYIKAEETFPTFSTGLMINTIDNNTKFVSYDNKAIFQTKDGIYYLNLNGDTANQSYSAKELSYYIREDLSKDLWGSSLIVNNGILYAVRKDRNNVLRVYVADKNKYSFINSEAQYNWWVLDGIPAYYMFNYNDKLYFLNDYKIYTFGKDFIDDDTITTDSVVIGNSTFSTEIQFNTDNESMIISNGSLSFQKIQDMYMYNRNIDYADWGEIYKSIKANMTIEMQGDSGSQSDLYMELGAINLIALASNDSHHGMLLFPLNENDTRYTDFANMLMGKMICFTENSTSTLYRCNVVKYEDWNPRGSSFDVYGGENYIVRNGSICAVLYLNYANELYPVNVPSYTTLLNLTGIELTIKEMKASTIFNTTYELDEVSYDKNYYDVGGAWIDEYGNYIADSLTFNKITFTLCGLDVNFFNVGYDLLVNINITKFNLKMPIYSLWMGKFTDFGRIDVLKTTKAIHFVPETKRGGVTKVGYRTRTKNKDFETVDVGFNFNDISFDVFSFDNTYFAKTYSSKKKIKNFSYIQLLFYSKEKSDSTIVQLEIKYSYSKNNKGVK